MDGGKRRRCYGAQLHFDWPAAAAALLLFLAVFSFSGASAAGPGLAGSDKLVGLGAIFTLGDDDEEMAAFRYGLARHSEENVLVKLRALTAEISNGSTALEYSSKLCDLLQNGAFAVFGTVDAVTEPLMDSYAGALRFPFVTSSRAPSSAVHRHKIRLMPNVGPALASMVKHLKWSRLHYVYCGSAGLRGLEQFTDALHRSFPPQYVDVRYHRTRSLDDVLSRLKMIFEQEVPLHKKVDVNVILDLPAIMTRDVLYLKYEEKARRLFFHYLLANLEATEVIDWTMFDRGGMNVTALRLIDDRNASSQHLLRGWRAAEATSGVSGGEGRKVTLPVALTIDALKVIITAFTRQAADFPYAFSRVTKRATCDGELQHSDDLGNRLADYMRKVEFDGLSGRVKFDEYGNRINYFLQIIDASRRTPPVKSGIWRADDSTIISLPTPVKFPPRLVNGQPQLAASTNKTKIVTTVLSQPYLFYRMHEPGSPKPEGNDRYQGYVADLLKKVSELAQFDYLIKPAADGAHGIPFPNDSTQWNGMVGEVMRGEADLAVGDLTITSEREEVIYFSKPFLSLGISIMIKKPEEQKQSIFSFMTPLANEVWMSIAFGYIGVSVVLFLVGRFSPYEWYEDSSDGIPVMRNGFSIWNSLWFALSTLMQQGCETAPRSTSCRIVASVWYLFTLIIISSYTANLAAFLTAARMNSPIGSVDDLAKQTAIKYGVLATGTTRLFFQHSEYPTYEKMWSFMSKHPDVFVSSNQEGIDRVRSSNGKYAYLIESTTNEYVNSRQPCDTMKVGANLNSRGYGFGMPQDSDLRHRINIAILLLRERGVLDELEKKWWHQIGDICPRSATDSAASANELTLPQIAGIFYILAAGLALSLVIACMEVAARAKIDSFKSDGAIGFPEAFKTHLRLFAKGSSAGGDKGSSAPSLTPSESGNQRKSPLSRQESPSQHLTVTSVPPPPRFGNAPTPPQQT